MKACYLHHISCYAAVFFCVAVCGIFQGQRVQAKESILLQKILFNHVPELTDELDKRLELGSLTVYFSERPTIHTLPSSKGRLGEVVFFIPQVEIKDAALKKILVKMQSEKTTDFKVVLKEVKTPVKGMTLTLSFDPVKIAYSHDTFDSISLSPGVVFTFYNRALIKDLAVRSADKGLLRMACSEKKKTVVLDCGHGGVDKGAAHFKGVEEKILPWRWA